MVTKEHTQYITACSVLAEGLEFTEELATESIPQVINIASRFGKSTKEVVEEVNSWID